MRHSLLLASVLVLLPITALAATSETYDFRGNIPGKWPVQGWTNAASQADGLHVSTSTDGVMTTMRKDAASAQTVTITTISPTATKAAFVWHPRGISDGLVQLPLTIPVSDHGVQTTIDLTHFPQWDPQADAIGLALGAGAQVTVQEITLIHYSPFERLWTGLTSLTHMDTMQSFSINFLWGPLIAFSPEEMKHLYEGQPPYSWSAMRYVYEILALALITWFLVRWNGRPRRARRILIVTCITLWLLLDLRMSAEVISYAVHDLQSFVMQPDGKKIFRDHGVLNDMTQQSTKWLQEVPQYAVASDLPVLGTLRYATIPSLPIAVSTNSALTHWVVFEDPSVAINDQGQLTNKGVVLSAPGKIIERFSPSSFTFQTQ